MYFCEKLQIVKSLVYIRWYYSLKTFDKQTEQIYKLLKLQSQGPLPGNFLFII